jgi:putative phage-type endonuclease
MTTTSEQFQAERDSSLGGSDAASILGVKGAYGTPLSVYLEKVEGKRTEESEWMRQGTALEPLLRSAYEKRNGRAIALPEFVRHEAHPFIGGHVDGTTSDKRIWEGKVVRRLNDDWGEPGSDQVPAKFLVQVQHYMELARSHGQPMEFADLTVRDLGSATDYDYTIAGNAEWCGDVLVPTLVAFWNDHIVPRVPPDPGVGEAKDRYPTTVANNYVEATDELVAKWDIYLGILDSQRDVVKVLAEMRHEFEMAMGEEGDHLVRPDGVVLCTWKNGKPRTTIDTKALKSQYPEVYERLAKTSDTPTRTFLAKLTNNGGDE